jgi:hypothetical protein
VVSRLPPPTCRPVQTRFRFGYPSEMVNLAGDGKSPDHYAKGTPSPCHCWHRALRACKHVVSGSLSSPWSGFFPSFARATGSLSVVREYLALRDGPRGFRPAFTCLVLLRCRIDRRLLSPTGLSPAAAPHSRGFDWDRRSRLRSYNPTRTSPGGLGWSAFARRY